MGTKDWFRFLRKSARSTGSLGTVSRAALAGEAFGKVMEIAARNLLQAGRGERVGIWLASEGQDWWEGIVLQADSGCAPEDWRRLDVSAPFLPLLLTNRDPVVTDPRTLPGASAVGALAGMRTAAWVPLRVEGETRGLALVANRAGLRPHHLDSLRVLADELALALTLERSRQASSRSEAAFRSVLDSVENSILLFDLGGHVRQVNARFAKLLDLQAPAGLPSPPELWAFESLAEVIRERFREGGSLVEQWRDLARRGQEPVWQEMELVRPVRKVVERSGRPVRDAAGQRIGWLEVFRDITAERALHSKLLQTEKMASLGQLVSGVAHELNNPLTSILGYTQLLRERRPGRAAELQSIFQEAERAGRIVKNLLQFARETGPERRSVDLNEVVERALELRRYELKVENIAVESDLALELPRAWADAHLMQQVVLNLVVNAEQAILQACGQGRIRIRTRWLAPPDGARHCGEVALEVADDGPGIPPEIVTRIFEPFFTTKPAGVGTGLGLSIAYGIVREHGGEISVQSQPGRGATFTVQIPCESRSAMPRGKTHPEPPPGAVGEAKTVEVRAAQGSRSSRVLVVEDEPTVARLIADVLGEEGYRAETVLDSLEGLNRASRGRYDLIICDLRMPRLDGRAFYEALVSAGNPAQHRMVFITGDTLAPRALDFLKRSRLPYLAKPFLVEELKAVVSRVLESAARREHPGVSAGASGAADGLEPSRAAGSLRKGSRTS